MSQSSLQSIQFETFDDEIYIRIDELINFLKSNYNQEDKKKIIKRENILHELKHHKSGLTEEESITRIHITSFYIIILHHYDDFKICQKVCDELLNRKCFKANNTSGKSTWDLYNEIVKEDLFSASYFQRVCLKINLDIPSLQKQYKNNFSKEAWEIIQLFEWHFKL